MKRFFEGFQILTGPQWIFIVFGVLTTAFGVFTAWKFNYIPAYLTAFVGVTGLTLLAERINNFIFQNNTRQDFMRIIKEEEGLQLIGNSSDAIDLAHKKRHGVKVVFNTVFDRHSAPGTDSNLQHSLPKFLDTTVEMIKNGCVWHDIYTEDNEEDIRQFRESKPFTQLSEQEKARYKSYRIDVSDTPMFQCLVLKHSDDDGFVFFGWTFRNGDESRVFGSGARDNVRYFSQFCNRLIVSSPDSPRFRSRRPEASLQPT